MWENCVGKELCVKELCGKKLVRRDGGSTWWWNEGVKDAVAKKKKAFKDLFKDGCEANKLLYNKIWNKTKKVVASAMRKEAEKETKDSREKPNYVFKLVKLMERDRKGVIGERCMKGKDGNLAFTEQDRKTIWKEHMERVMNEANEWDQITNVDVVEGPKQKSLLRK